MLAWKWLRAAKPLLFQHHANPGQVCGLSRGKLTLEVVEHEGEAAPALGVQRDADGGLEGGLGEHLGQTVVVYVEAVVVRQRFRACNRRPIPHG